MNQIWANRLIAGTQKWSDVPATRREAVYVILAATLTEEELNNIINEGEDING